MESARIALFEDDGLEIEALESNIALTSHELVYTARNLTDSLQAVTEIMSGQIEVDAIVLDGNLGRQRTNGEDARDVMRALGYPDEMHVPVIGYSTVPLEVYGLVPTHDVTKYGDLYGTLDRL